jgi:hypothetical protein
MRVNCDNVEGSVDNRAAEQRGQKCHYELMSETDCEMHLFDNDMCDGTIFSRNEQEA